MKTRVQILVGALLAILVLAFPALAAEKNAVGSLSLRQKQSDLLAGEFWAICYSGFRAGQHPDRGDGAKNPTDDQILEDLRIRNTAAEFVCES